MKTMHGPDYKQLPGSAGFTLTEVIIVIALMAIFSAFALPPFIEWQRNQRYKEAAIEIASMLKTAKSRAITLNQQHGVQLIPAERAFQIGRFQNNQWTYSTRGVLEDSKLTLNLNETAASAVPPTPNVLFNSNGTTFGNYSIRIMDATVRKYSVTVERTGRINTSKAR